ncbi:PAS domain-containing protein [Sinorhizobium meliloti]|uniref:PAS domain-containing protein n=1 Tax=Rhizobium meliloti TaxID=382 RepID=UPI00299E2668|nr:PAS domain S-box protein [Sinorhizobium meliloti]MDW9621762.1 PAS domain S-box protein [Sinorhizobium meliloti]MDX0160031.1 PAS domain S-box protein [Sinorhizobium meliloti]MDX0178938.1 PAS domain S-box protein [Sinorhizobium meliloti]
MQLEIGRILDALPTMLWTALPDGSTAFVNRRWSDYTGSGLNDDDGREWHFAVCPDDLPDLLKRWQFVLASGEPGELKARLRRFDGRYRWHLIQCSPVCDESKRISLWCGVGVDIEDHRRSAEFMRRQKLDFQLIVDSIPVPVAVTTPSGEVEGLNKSTLGYFGKSFEELKGWKTSDAVHPDDLEQTIAAQMKAHQQGVSYDIESRHRRHDGTYRWHNVRGFPLRDPRGRIVRWCHLLIDIDDRKQAERALHESELEARLIVETIPGGIEVLAPTGKVELVNEHVARYFGKTAEELKRSGFTELIHPEDLQIVHTATLRATTTGLPYEAEHRFLGADGTYRWFQVRGLPLRDARGRVVRWYALHTDIDDKKRAEEALLESERNLKLTLDTIPALAWAADRDGSAEYFNRHYLDYVGLSAEQAKGWGWTDALHPDDKAGLAAAWRAILASGRPGEAEVRLRRYDGTYRWLLFRTSPLRDAQGNIVKWYGVNTDIDDRKCAEQELKRSEAFLAEGQHLARMGNLSWNVARGSIVWSQPLYHIFDFEPGSVITLDLIASRVPPEDMPLMGDMIERAQRGESGFEYQHRIILPDKSIKYLHLIAHKARNNSGETEYIGAVLDITQRQLSEEALEKVRFELAQVTRIMSLGVLTASIAHEVNQPLAGIITNASTCLRMLAADPPNIKVAQETARRTIRDGNRAADVISRLRTLFSKRTVAIEPIDMNEAVREVLALSSGDLQRSGVAARAEFANRLPHVGGDRIQLQQVIINLLRNACDAMGGVDDRPRRLLIRTAPVDDHVQVSVQDTGIGLQPASAARVFQAFYTTKSDGMGIGLSVSRFIVENHNGRLWAQPNDGPGVTFSFSIPQYCWDTAPARDLDAATDQAENASAVR